MFPAYINDTAIVSKIIDCTLAGVLCQLLRQHENVKQRKQLLQ